MAGTCMGTGSLLITCLAYMSIFLHMSAIVSTNNHNSILSIKLQAILFQNVSAKPISAPISTTGPQASTLHELMEKGKGNTDCFSQHITMAIKKAI